MGFSNYIWLDFVFKPIYHLTHEQKNLHHVIKPRVYILFVCHTAPNCASSTWHLFIEYSLVLNAYCSSMDYDLSHCLGRIALNQL